MKEWSFRSFVWSVGLLVLLGSLIWLVVPDKPVDLSAFKLHSEKYSAIDQSVKLDILKYYAYKSASIFTEMNLLGLFSAILIATTWYYYIRGLDFFNKEKIFTTVLTLLLGMLLCFLVFPISDFVHELLKIKYSESIFYNLFVYSFLGIGIIEEFVKLLPVLVVFFLFAKEIDEPFDFIYYACLSALGFAFIENLIYFREISGFVIVGRALTSVLGHMIDASFVVYGLLLYKFHPKKNSFSIVVLFFIAGAFVHGLYDYLLFESQLFLFMLIFIFIIQTWAIMINNAMNNSRFFNYKTIEVFDQVKFRLAVFLTSIILFSFLINGFMMGKHDATVNFIVSLPYFCLLIIFYASKMSSIDLFKGYWRPLRLKVAKPREDGIIGSAGLSSLGSVFTENTISPLNHVGKRIKLHCPAYNRYLSEIFIAGNGRIVDRVKLIKDEKHEDISWFLVKLDTPLDVDESYVNNFIFIRLVHKYEPIEHDEDIECSVKLIPKGKTHKSDPNFESYLGYGKIIINGDDDA